MNRTLFILCFSIVVSYQSVAQIYSKTFVAGGENPVTDAMVGSGGLMNTNMSTFDFMNVSKDNQTTPIVYRTFLQYDLTSIPREAILISAKLKLTVKTVSPVNFSYGIERVAEEWHSNSITWQNQPTTILSDIIKVDQPNSMTTVQEIDVYKHVYHMLRMPFFNNGWCVKLWDESGSGSNYGNSYYSSDHSSSNLRPSLELTYMMPHEIEGIVTHCTAGNSDGAIDFTVTGGSSEQPHLFRLFKLDTASGINNYGMSYTYFHYANRSNGIVDNNVIDADSLEPGAYVAQVYDSLHTKVPNYGSVIGIQVISSKHFFVGREGEVTNISFTRDVEHMNVAIDIDGSLPNSEYVNAHGTTSTVAIRSAFSGTDSYTSGTSNAYKIEGYFDLLADFPNTLQFESAKLIHRMHSTYQHTNSSNAIELVPCTSDWTERTVTWNYRPTVDYSKRISIPKTSNNNGYTTSDDTLNILSFVNYWQNNPNYGYLQKLQDYSYPNASYRQYIYFSKISTGRFEASFTVKSPVSAEFNDTTGFGSITVNAPAGNLPYTYLIGYDSIPELSVIWASIKDSIPIDSATFFSGKENSISHTFENLESGKYHVSVFDNAGVKIFEKIATVKPNFKIFHSTNSEIDESGVLKQIDKTQDAQASIVATLKSGFNGGFGFTLKNVENGIIGFNLLTDDQPESVQDLEFGIEIDEEGVTEIYRNQILEGVFTTESNDNILMKKTGQKFQLIKNSELIYESDENEFIEEDYKIDYLLKGKQGEGNGIQLEPTLLSDYMNQTLVPMNINPQKICGEMQNAFCIQNPFDGYILNVTIVNLLTGEYVYVDQGTSSSSETCFSLPIGTYSVNYSLNDPNSQISYPGGSQVVDVGYHIQWDLPSSVNHTVINGNELISDPYNLNGFSTSVNTLPCTDNGYASFKVKLYYQPATFPANNNIITEAGISIVDQSNLGHEIISSKIKGLGYSLLSRYLIVAHENANSTPTYYSFLTDNNASTYKIVHEAGAIQGNGTLKVLENNTIRLNYQYSNYSLLKLKGITTSHASIYDTKVSFCYPIPNQYIQLQRKLQGGYYKVQPDNILKVEYFEEYNDLDGTLKFAIKDKRGDVILDHNNTTLPSEYGDNRLDFDVASLTRNEFYTLEIINDKNETFYLRFKR